MNQIIERIRLFEHKTSLIFENESYTYFDIYFKIQQLYESISTHINKGEVVSIQGDYSFLSIATFFALLQNKNIVVPITTKVQKEIDERQKTSNVKFIIKFLNNDIIISQANDYCDENHLFVKKLINSNKSGLILFSSGSTGAPKAMIHDLDNLVESFDSTKKGKNLSFMIFLMFDHIGGLNTLLHCISAGLTMVFPTNRNPDNVCNLIEKFNVNVLPASPTFLNLILISDSYIKYNLNTLKLITYGTETMPENLLLKLKKTFPSVKFLQTFGTSETGISQTSSKSSQSTFIKIEDPNTDYKIVNDELYIRTKTQILGYLNQDSDRFTEDGWFKTGDLVELSTDGYLKIIGRNKEIINVGGEKVLPSEVESILFKMPEIKDCLVFGEANPIVGQIVVAKILFNHDFKLIDAKKIVTGFCRDKLDKYKIPSKIIIMSESEFTERFKKKRN